MTDDSNHTEITNERMWKLEKRKGQVNLVTRLFTFTSLVLLDLAFVLVFEGNWVSFGILLLINALFIIQHCTPRTPDINKSIKLWEQFIRERNSFSVPSDRIVQFLQLLQKNSEFGPFINEEISYAIDQISNKDIFMINFQKQIERGEFVRNQVTLDDEYRRYLEYQNVYSDEKNARSKQNSRENTSKRAHTELKPEAALEIVLQGLSGVKQNPSNSNRKVNDKKGFETNDVLKMLNATQDTGDGMAGSSEMALVDTTVDKAFFPEMYYHWRVPTIKSLERYPVLPDQNYMKITSIIENMDGDWDFDIFEFEKISGGRPILFAGFSIIQKYGISAKWNIEEAKLRTFLICIEGGYFSNPYHNNIHGADVFTTMNYFLKRVSFERWMTDVEAFASLIGALIHDFMHPGTTNQFIILSGDNRAIIHNDRSVLENFHIASTFFVMKRYNCDIFSNMEPEDKKTTRTTMIEAVLATDLSLSFAILADFKKKLSTGFDLEKREDRIQIMKMALKISDVSHTCKDWSIHFRWSKLVCLEFFTQGEKEKQLHLPISPFMDWKTANMAKSQVGFIDFLVLPMVEQWQNYLDAFDNCLYETQHNQKRASVDSIRIVRQATFNENEVEQKQENFSHNPRAVIPSHMLSRRNSNSKISDVEPWAGLRHITSNRDKWSQLLPHYEPGIGKEWNGLMQEFNIDPSLLSDPNSPCPFTSISDNLSKDGLGFHVV